jgi:hypothetical protein
MNMASHVDVRTVLTRPHQRNARPLRLSSPKGVHAKKSASGVHASYSIYELSPRFSTRAYTIRDGDTLYKIAQKRGTYDWFRIHAGSVHIINVGRKRVRERNTTTNHIRLQNDARIKNAQRKNFWTFPEPHVVPIFVG